MARYPHSLHGLRRTTDDTASTWTCSCGATGTATNANEAVTAQQDHASRANHLVTTLADTMRGTP